MRIFEEKMKKITSNRKLSQKIWKFHQECTLQWQTSCCKLNFCVILYYWNVVDIENTSQVQIAIKYSVLRIFSKFQLE